MMSLQSWVLLLVIYITYLVIGMFSFRALEYCEEGADDGVEQWMDMRFDHSNPSHNQSEKILKRILKQKIDHVAIGKRHGIATEIDGENASNRSYHVFYALPREDCDKWNYWNSLMFSFTAITTIGYGHIFPRTDWGKGLCIIYSLLGVPINGILIASLALFFGQKLTKFREKRPNEKKSENQYIQLLLMVIHVIAYLIPGLIIFLIVPAVVIQKVEGWSYLDSFYCAFITLTTIGFGDLVPGKNSDALGKLGNWKPVYEAGIILWIIFGLGYIFLLITIITDMIKKPAQKATKKLKAAEKQLVSKILHEIIALRSPDGYDENDVVDSNDEDAYRHIDVFNVELEERNTGYDKDVHQKFNGFYKESTSNQKSHRNSVGIYEELSTAETVDSLIDDMTQDTISSLHTFFSSAIEAKKELRKVSQGINGNRPELVRRHSHAVLPITETNTTTTSKPNIFRVSPTNSPHRMRSKSTAGYERYKILKPTIPPNSFHAKHKKFSNDNIRFPSVEEEDFCEINEADKKQFQINRVVRNSSSGSQKDEIQSRKSLSDHVNQSKEQGPENVSVEEEKTTNRLENHGRYSVSHKASNNQENMTRKQSILPDLLRTVTLEEIIHAVDIVTEEEEENENEIEDQKVSNLGVLDESKGPVFLQGLSSYHGDT